MLTATNLYKRYGARPVLRGLNFEVRPGEVVAVAGANGAGKSTLLRLVAGLLEPSKGEIRWNGESTRGMCALAAPDAPLYRELTCLENLRFFASESPSEQTLISHLDRWGLGKRGGDFCGELSSGLRVRLQLAVADWFKPPILLLDEPSANLDASGRELVIALLEEQRGRGITLLATNDPRDLEWCERRIEVG